jgi:hypothetical protein
MTAARIYVLTGPASVAIFSDVYTQCFVIDGIMEDHKLHRDRAHG